MKKSKVKRPLSVEETAVLLGADQVDEIGPVQLDPITMRVMATRIGKRLVSKGGRPTDASWEITRKVPMRKDTWDQLRAAAEALGTVDVRTSAGQLAAMALERGLPCLLREKGGTRPPGMQESTFAKYDADSESQEEAEDLYPVINEKGLW